MRWHLRIRKRADNYLSSEVGFYLLVKHGQVGVGRQNVVSQYIIKLLRKI